MGISDSLLSPGVYGVETPLGDRRSTLYLFVGSERSLLFDVGVNGAIPDHLLPFAESNHLSLSRIETVVVSHCDVDHFGGIQDAHDFLPSATVLAHELDAHAMENFDAYETSRGRSFRTPYGFDPGEDDWSRQVVREGRVDRRLTGDEKITLGDRTVDIVHLPGHTRGHLGIYDKTYSFLAISDAILGEAVPLASQEPAFPPTYRHERLYSDSIERVRGLRVQTMATAHYGVFEGDEVSAFLDASCDFVRALKGLVHSVVSGAPGLDLMAITERIDPLVGDWPKGVSVPALTFPVVAHLEQLESEGLIRREMAGQPPRAVFIDSSP